MNSEWELKEVDKYIITNKILGKGNQATVFQAYRKDNNQLIAAKVYNRSTLANSHEKKNLVRQIEMNNSIKHPYIMNCYDIKSTNNNIYFFMEYCNGGDLENYLRQNTFISESDCLDFLNQIVQAFLMLQKNHIVHRDLKPANILLKNGQLKIADFGFAKKVTCQDIINTAVGSPIFMCPQALVQQGQYNLMKGDVWSAGICLYYMLYKQYPFVASSLKDLIQTLKIQQLVFPDNISQRSEAVKDLISHMLDKDEDKRYTWDQVANHRCLNKGSDYEENPLLRSMELNQFSGISSFNNELKNVEMQTEELKAIKEDSVGQAIEQEELAKGLEKNNVNLVLEKVKEIHCILRLQSQFALIYRILWKGYFQLLKVSEEKGFEDESLRNATFLLIHCLLMKENKFLRDLVHNARECVQFRIKHHQLIDIKEKDLDMYFDSEIFANFHANLRQTYRQDTCLAMQNYAGIIQAHLIEAGLQEHITEEQCNYYIAHSLSILNFNLHNMAEEALKQENKTFLILLIYLFFLQNDERRLQEFKNPNEHYQKIMRRLEEINFMSTQQIYNQINEFIVSDLNAGDQGEDEDEDNQMDQENYNNNSLINKFT